MKKVYNKLVRDRMIDIYKHDVENKVSASDYSIRYMDKAEKAKRGGFEEGLYLESIDYFD